MSKESLNTKIDYRISRFYEDKNIKNCFHGIKKDIKQSVKSIKERLKIIEKKDSPAFKPFYDRFYKIIDQEMSK